MKSINSLVKEIKQGGEDFEFYPTTQEIVDKVETYSLNSEPIMPKFPIPEEFGTEEGYRQKYTEKDLFDEFTQDEKGNVVLSQEEAEKTARQLLERIGLADKAHAYPAQLSGGQTQRVAIVRALAMNPEVLLFDEPTSALDPEMVGEVQALMRDLAGDGMTMIVVSHDVAFACELADRIIFLEKGRVLEDDSPEELRSSANERIREFLAVRHIS